VTDQGFQPVEGASEGACEAAATAAVLVVRGGAGTVGMLLLLLLLAVIHTCTNGTHIQTAM
jgi:hypothetical protein